ncbi:MAG: tetratricopeptide repeat protein [Bryobacterales bacterium]
MSAVLLAAQQNLDQTLTEGVLALDRGENQKAYEALTAVVEKRPKDGRALVGLAEAARRLGKAEEADAHIEQVAELARRQPQFFRGLSMYYENGNEPDKAAQYEAFYVRAFPDDLSGFGRAAALHLAAGDGRSAAEFARSGLERENSAPLQDILGKALASIGDQTGAETALREAVRLSPYDEEYRYDLGYLFLRDQRFEEAVRELEDARKVFDKSARIELGIGVARYGQRPFNDAVTAFLRSADLAPGAPQPHYFLGRMLEHATDRIDAVLKRQKAFAELQPENYLGPFLYGQALSASLPPSGADDVAAEAEQLLRRSIALRGDFWESHFELGAVLERQKRYADAAASLERAVELNPNSSKPHYRLARIYARLGRKADAARERDLHRKLTEAEREAMQGGMTLQEPLIK